KLRHGLAALGDQDGFALPLDFIHDRQTVDFKFTCRHFLHWASFRSWSLYHGHMLCARRIMLPMSEFSFCSSLCASSKAGTDRLSSQAHRSSIVIFSSKSPSAHGLDLTMTRPDS